MKDWVLPPNNIRFNRTTRVIQEAYDDDGLDGSVLAKELMSYKLEEVAELACYWATAALGMVMVMAPADDRLDIPDTSWEYIVKHISNQGTIQILRLVSNGRPDEVLALVRAIFNSSTTELMDALGYLAVLMLKLGSVLPVSPQGLLHRAAMLRLQLMHARAVLQQQEWCADDLDKAFDVLIAMDDRKPFTPLDDNIGSDKERDDDNR